MITLTKQKNEQMVFDLMNPEELIRPEGFSCSCGRQHRAEIRFLRIAPGALSEVTKALSVLGCSRPMVVCGPHGYEAAGKTVCSLLEAGGIAYSLHRLDEENGERIKPSEHAAGSLLLGYDQKCDMILGVGSGVINDLCKVLCTAAKVPCMIVATAPSMDGYASDSASVEIGSIKYSLKEKMPEAILCDTQILAKAPQKMIRAGMGDILAKYTSLIDWKISHIVTGECYCDLAADLVRDSLRRTVAVADGVRESREETVLAITEGLVLSGIGITFAGCSHPASGLEHYFSHCWEMMQLEKGKDSELHGIQVSIGMLLTLKIIEYLKTICPVMEHAEAAAGRFDEAVWEKNIRRVFPKAADGILEIEKQTRKNDRAGRLERAAIAIAHWDEILSLFQTELPSYEETKALMRRIGMPVTPREIGLTNREVIDAFVCSRDIRDKYLLSSLIWDIGYMEETTAMLKDVLYAETKSES